MRTIALLAIHRVTAPSIYLFTEQPERSPHPP